MYITIYKHVQTMYKHTQTIYKHFAVVLLNLFRQQYIYIYTNNTNTYIYTCTYINIYHFIGRTAGNGRVTAPARRRAPGGG